MDFPTDELDERNTDEFAYSLVSEAVPAALTPKQVELASAKDPTLQVVRQAVMTDDWSKFAYSLVSEAVPAALTPKQVELASAKDRTLQVVRQAVMTDDWSKLQGSIYRAVKDELWIFGQLVMRGDRVVMPQSLWEHIIKLAHEGHQGMVRTKLKPDCEKKSGGLRWTNKLRKGLEPVTHASLWDPDHTQSR